MPHEHAPYVPFNLECPVAIIGMVRNREVRTNLPLFCKEAHTLESMILGVTVGEPGAEPKFGAASEIPVDKLEECKAALDEAQTQLQSFGAEAADGDQKIDPATILLIVQLVSTLISKWLENRKK